MPADADAALDVRPRARRRKADGAEVVVADVEVGERRREVERDTAIEGPLEAGDEADAPSVRGLRGAAAEHEVFGKRLLVEEVAARVEPRQAAAHLEVGLDAPVGQHPRREEVGLLKSELQTVDVWRPHAERSEAETAPEAPRALGAEEAQLPGDRRREDGAELVLDDASSQVRAQTPSSRTHPTRNRRARISR